MHSLIENNRVAIEALCRRHGVRALAVFGSILRDDFDTERSDVDVLVEFEADVAGSFSKFPGSERVLGENSWPFGGLDGTTGHS